MSPCPSTGRSSGKCPGYIIDHVKALACGGADAPSNMQWQTVRAAKEKDAWERDDCSMGATSYRSKTIPSARTPDFTALPKTTTHSGTGFDSDNNRRARENFGRRSGSGAYPSGGGQTLQRGARGGCYYETPSGKQYVDRSKCN